VKRLRDCEWDRHDQTWYQHVASRNVGQLSSSAEAGSAFGYGESATARPSFTGIYPLDYSSGDRRRAQGVSSVQYLTMGVTAVWPVYNSTGHLLAVFGVDLNLAYFSTLLYQLQASIPGANDQTRFFLLDALNQIVASSTREHAQLVFGSVYPLQGAASADRIVSTTAAYVPHTHGRCSFLDCSVFVLLLDRFLGNSSAQVRTTNTSKVTLACVDFATIVSLILFLGLFEGFPSTE
jgi:hypothetical protein